MKISTWKHFLTDGLKNLRRNRTISTAAAATVAATLFILGVFLLGVVNIKEGIKEVESKVEVKIFLKDDIKINDQKDLEDSLKNTPGVVDVKYETKGEALDNLKDQLGEQNKSLVEGLDKDNPMPNSYIVKVSKPEQVTTVVKSIKDKPGIDTIKDGRDVVNKLITFTNAIKWAGIVIFIILVGVSLFLIGNTIKLTVFSRRREIGIMKYIGATDWFIRWPFVIEGVIIGVAGSLVAVGVLYYAYRMAYLKLSSAFLIAQLVSPQYVLTNILGIFILAGALIGGLGSIFAIRKFLSV